MANERLTVTCVSVGCSLLMGCSGNIVLSPLDPTTMGNPTVVRDINSSAAGEELSRGYHGLVVYLPVQRIEVDRFTQIQALGPDNKTLIATENCDPNSPEAITRKVVTVADSSRPFLLQYHHGFLETYTFAATINADGTLASINTNSTPDQGKTISNLASAASTVGKIFPIAGNPPCTMTPTFWKYEPIPPVTEPQ